MTELPEDYKRGFKFFLGAKVDLSKRPLIPREETEYWVKVFIDENHKNIKCLDLFSGSGCIGLSILKNVDSAHCDFGEIEDSFLDQIKINLRLNNVDEKRYKIIKTNVFSGISEKYDFILANPPYVAENRIDEVGEDVKDFEPEIALYGGEDGLKLINVFLRDAKHYLNEGGKILMEFDEEQKEEIEEIVKNSYSDYNFYKDQFNRYRFIKIKK
jgi:release factor glutamine methyltransferase